jgi:hypothetical protein
VRATASPDELWPWLALAGLGLFHGINPAMGWLFAVALGLQRGSRRIVLLALIPIALGHGAAVAAVLFGVLALGLVLDHATLMRAAAVLLIGWAFWHAIYGHRQRLYVGMQTGLAGLLLWSFLMASAHGAGLMLLPIVLPICSSAAATSDIDLGAALPLAAAAVGIHFLAMLATIAAISVLVYEWIGVAFLRRGWVNLDQIWVAALVLCGLVLLAV